MSFRAKKKKNTIFVEKVVYDFMEVFTPVGPYDLCLHFRELISDFLDWKGKQGQKSMAMHNELFTEQYV